MASSGQTGVGARRVLASLKSTGGKIVGARKWRSIASATELLELSRSASAAVIETLVILDTIMMSVSFSGDGGVVVMCTVGER